MEILHSICVDLLGDWISLSKKRKRALIFWDEKFRVTRNPLNETLKFHVIKFHPCKKKKCSSQLVKI